MLTAMTPIAMLLNVLLDTGVLMRGRRGMVV